MFEGRAHAGAGLDFHAAIAQRHFSRRDRTAHHHVVDPAEMTDAEHFAGNLVEPDAEGGLVLLEDQDRSRWDRAQVVEAQVLIDRALGSRRVGPYLLQAAIASVHVEAPDFARTDWTQIVGLYDVLRRVDPSPIVSLNRAAAIGMRDGPEAGLAAIESVLEQGELDQYPLAHSARAEMQRRLGRVADARTSYQRALELTRQPAERRFLQKRLDELAHPL